MPSFIKRMLKLPNYINRFGLLHGIRLWLKVERPLSKKSIVIKKYAVPGYPDLIYLRESVSDHSIFWQCIVQRQYEIAAFPQKDRLLSTYDRMVNAGNRPLIIDCGGNIGLSALFLATIFPEAVVCAIEPEESNFEMLKLNTKALSDRVVGLKGGIWNESTTLRITNPESGSAAFRVADAKSKSEQSVRAYTIREVCDFVGADAPFIVKIDIEGAQANLFRSQSDWVGNTHLVMLELDDWLMPWEGTSRSFFACMSRYPFDYLLSGETIFCFRDFGTD